MNNKLQETFFPTKEQQIKQLERLIEICKNNRENNCNTCKYNIPSKLTIPISINDYGSCSKNCKIFIRKSCHLSDEYCKFWEDDGVIDNWKQKIEELKQKIEELKKGNKKWKLLNPEN